MKQLTQRHLTQEDREDIAKMIILGIDGGNMAGNTNRYWGLEITEDEK